MSNFKVELKKVVDDSYEVQIGKNLIPELVKDLTGGLAGNIHKFAVITDSTVEPLYGRQICDKLNEAGAQAELFVFPAGEKSKVRKTKEILEDAMLAKGFRRDCCVVAIGGGVVSDLAGFVAGTFGRGVPFVNYATTLLAAADASIGGKTAVDTDLATNLIGLIYQPKKVYVDIDTWKTLPKNHLVNGMAETIKHACMASSDLFTFLEEHMDDIMHVEQGACEHIAKENCKIKYHVVEKDEKESGLREILNLGHTVGRAIETVSDYRLLHGEALAIGMIAQALLAESLGYMTKDMVERVRSLYQKAGLPVTIPAYIDREELVKKLYTDKKVKNGKLRFVVEKGIGNIVEFEPGVYATPIEESVARKIIAQI